MIASIHGNPVLPCQGQIKIVITYHQIYMYVPTIIYMLRLYNNLLEVNYLLTPPPKKSFTIPAKDLFLKEI